MQLVTVTKIDNDNRTKIRGYSCFPFRHCIVFVSDSLIRCWLTDAAIKRSFTCDACCKHFLFLGKCNFTKCHQMAIDIVSTFDK